MAAAASQTLRSILHESPSSVGIEEYSIVHAEEDLENYAITKIPTHQIYKETLVSRVNFLNDYKIKIVEENFPLDERKKDIYLLSREAIRKHRSKYDFLHIGLVQVSIAPLTFRPNTKGTVLICLRNAKYLNFQESVLVAFESSVRHGAIKFNWFPNFSSPLSDLANFNALVLTIEPHGYDMKEGSCILAINYRMCYKLMKTSLEAQSFYESPVLEVNTEKINILMPISSNRNEMQKLKF